MRFTVLTNYTKKNERISAAYAVQIRDKKWHFHALIDGRLWKMQKWDGAGVGVWETEQLLVQSRSNHLRIVTSQIYEILLFRGWKTSDKRRRPFSPDELNWKFMQKATQLANNNDYFRELRDGVSTEKPTVKYFSSDQPSLQVFPLLATEPFWLCCCFCLLLILITLRTWQRISYKVRFAFSKCASRKLFSVTHDHCASL